MLGLEMGADDYLTKPFSVLELTARVKAIFRRMEKLAANNHASTAQIIDVAPLRIDTKCRTVRVDEKPVELTTKEFDLLLFFVRNPGRVYNRGQLLDQVWGYSHSGYEHTVNSHINRAGSAGGQRLLLAIAAHRFAQESELALDALADDALVDVQAQPNPVAEEQLTFLRLRDQPTRFLAVRQAGEAFEYRHGN